MFVDSKEMSYAIIPSYPHASPLSRLRTLKNLPGEVSSIYPQAAVEIHFLMDSFHVDTGD